MKRKPTLRLALIPEHHGIEALYPGPALMIRYKLE